MRWEATLLASSLVAVQAAPRLFDQAVQDVSGFEDAAKRDGAAAAALHVADGLYARFHAEMTTLPAGCPTASVVVSTTTVDVTVYITAEAVAESTEPCPDETSTSTSALSTTTASQSTPAPSAPGTISKDSSPPEETGKWNSTTTVASTPPQTPNAAATSTTIPLPVGPGSSIAVVLVSKNSTATTEPCPDETSSSTAGSSTSSQPHEAIATTVTSTQSSTRTSRVVTPPSVTSSSSSSVTPSSTMPTTTAAATPPTIVIIDPAMTPVTKSNLTVTPTSVAPPTKTVCEHSNPTGAPSRDTQYCGVKGSPAGVYFIAEFIEERPGVPVTEEGCYQFCDSVMEDTKGCKSYRFYQNALGAPRCDLYGMPVSYALKDLDTNQPGKWYDLACGCPTSEGWHDTSMPEHKRKKAAAIATPATATTAIPTKTTPAAEPKQDNHLLDLKLGPLSIGL